ncbi:hypothetical protein [Slackia exigua]|uniref:hypothetical protein n=1 Tax=Slackia exigua TaxID=84109 RepID=UPI003D0050AD|nr:hypothetical protein [Slackia exigua]
MFDRVEVSSPGGLPTGLSEEEYLAGRVSVLRNPVACRSVLSPWIYREVRYRCSSHKGILSRYARDSGFRGHGKLDSRNPA